VLDKNVGGRPRNGNLFVFDFSFADYIFIPIIYFVVGVILAIPLFFFIHRLRISLLISLFVSLLLSSGERARAAGDCSRPDFEQALFNRAIIQIISIFIIFPLIAFLIWVVKKILISKYQIQ
jgi:hypothetical protein